MLSDTIFPTDAYFNTGRGKGSVPLTYACLGNGSAVLNLGHESRALSWVAFHDTKDHHINFWVWGWPEGTGNPDYSKNLGTAHTLPETEAMEVVMAPGTPLEQKFTLPARKP